MADFEKSSNSDHHIDHKEPLSAADSQYQDELAAVIASSNIPRWSAASIKLYCEYLVEYF